MHYRFECVRSVVQESPWEARVRASCGVRGRERAAIVMAQQLLKTISGLKVREVPEFVKSTVTVANAQSAYNKWFHEYHAKHFVTGSVKPLTDLMLFVGVLGYTVAWPTEIRHLRHAEAAKRAGGDGHDHH
eukprot:TRINITY_DN2187_c0_g1_i1.p2 TRINITY_DN2187_c0_g1~~TRINITY_DN2187_c0_g1_i1.p2  ORF type:complete len:131 (+),score=8.59 TRINITY_DN2187_c0_g1_i1:12-404(+)